MALSTFSIESDARISMPYQQRNYKNILGKNMQLIYLGSGTGIDVITGMGHIFRKDFIAVIRNDYFRPMFIGFVKSSNDIILGSDSYHYWEKI